MRLVGHMVTHNEADRWLRPALTALAGAVDEMFVIDDRSTDLTRIIAEHAGARVVIRPEGECAFAEHEGRFRQEAWREMVHCLRLDDGGDTWVVAVDADEIILADRAAVAACIAATVAGDAAVDGLIVPIHETFGFGDDGVALVRVDGEWGRIHGLRIARHRAGADHEFRPMKLGCGSVPYRGRAARATCVELLHLGYATDADRKVKYARYHRRPGHNPGHTASILRPGKLERFDWLRP